MRVSTQERRFAVEPGATVEIGVDVVNTGSIIDGLTARLIGIDGATVLTEPALLPLFPDAEGHISVRLDVPHAYQAGAHPLTVEVLSHSTKTVAHADVVLDVAPRPAVVLQAAPRLVRARRSGRFVLDVANEGNVPLDVTLASPPGDRGVSTRITPDTLRVEPGTTAHAIAVIRGPRMITGGEVDRGVQVTLAGRRAGTAVPDVPDVLDVLDPLDEVETAQDLTAAVPLQLRQRPLVSRGLITAGILVMIIALWAGVFLFGLQNVFANDPLPKTAPASYFIDEPVATSGSLEQVANQVSDGLLPKTGLVSADVGGQVGGYVTAASDGNPVGRVLVEAFRQKADGSITREPVSTAATLDDGSYTLDGLFPTGYLLRFSGDNFQTRWFGGDADLDAGGVSGVMKPSLAVPIETGAGASSENNNIALRGDVGSIQGVVDPGDVVDPVTTTVTARMLDGVGTVAPPVSLSTRDGAYRFDGLRAPGTYELTFAAPGYQISKVVTELHAGDQREQPSVLLSAGGGEISGKVTIDGKVAGGVTVTTTVAGTPVSVVTPTTGSVGVYQFTGLPTPGSYLLTFSAPDVATRTAVVDLGAGGSATDVNRQLDAGAGSIDGFVTDGSGVRLGGVEVTVGGATTVDGSVPSTTTLTDEGAKGTFLINDLASPGTYTLTFSIEGYGSETYPVELTEAKPSGHLEIKMTKRLGAIRGVVVTSGDVALPGARITATNGSLVITATATSSSAGLPDGGFLMPGLPEGYYSVTATNDGTRQMTMLVRVTAGRTIELPTDFFLARDG